MNTTPRDCDNNLTRSADTAQETANRTDRLIVQGVFKYFGKTRALSDVNLKVSEGELCVLLGPSGCGKSTLLRIIAGLESASAGRILIDREDVTDVPPGKRDIAMVFQNYALYPHMTVFENIAFPLRVRKHPKNEIDPRVREVASLLQLEQLLERKPTQLSGGQRQRVAMGRAIVRRPRVFLFDEPLSNLDTQLRANMRIEISLLHRKLRATTIYVTHDQVEAMTMADTLAVFDQGVLRQIDSPARVYHQPADLMVAQFVGTPPMNLVPGALKRSASDGTLWFTSPSLRFPFPQGTTEGDAVAGIRPEHVSLDPHGPWSGKVTFVEDTGSDKYVHVELARGQRIVVRPQGDQELRPGDTVRVSIDEAHLHLFVQGKRLL